MLLIINGSNQNIDLKENTLQELLQNVNFYDKKIVVEHNAQIIMKKDFAQTKLSEKDKIEIIQLMGGG